MALLQNADFMAAVKQKFDAPEVGNLYMLAYQTSLEYTVASEMAVPADLLAGFTPVASLVMEDFKFPDGTVVKLPAPPTDVTPWSCFPQDYSKATEDFNRGCKELQASGKLPWSTPVAGYNDGENWSCDSANGWCADDIQALNWRVITGFEVCHPAVGCLKNPNGGAVMILQVNFLDSDEIWGPRNDSAVYVDSGHESYGIVFDLGARSTLGEDLAHVRNHWFSQLSNPQGGDNRYKGQCGNSALCGEITYVVVARTWDRPDLGINFAHYELLDYGTWSPPE